MMDFSFLRSSRLLIITALALAFTSCEKDDAQAQLTADVAIIEKYLSDNNLTAEEYDLGLYIVTDNEGNGNRPNSTSNVLIKYRGYLPNGIEFDESWNTAANFNLSGTIEGWRKGIPQFKEGGRGTILMASYLGYGKNAAGIIPANSVLIFDIDLIAVY
jgi:FKBP-type peptidyl-prolyl cis-trans isomerase FkpA